MLCYHDERLICKIGIYESSPCMAIRFFLESGEPFYTLTVNPPELIWREFTVPNIAVLNLDLDFDQQPMIVYLGGRYDSSFILHDSFTGRMNSYHLFIFESEFLMKVDPEGYKEYLALHDAYFHDR